MTRESDAMQARKAEGLEPRRGGSAGREASPETPSGHAKDCLWHFEQYSWECTCGFIKSPKKGSQMTNMVEDVARAMCFEGGFGPDEIMPNDGPRWKYYVGGAQAAIAAMRLHIDAEIAVDGLAALLTREGKHSGVWFSLRLLEAADKLRALAARVQELEEHLRIINRETSGVVRDLDNYEICISSVNKHTSAALGGEHD